MKRISLILFVLLTAVVAGCGQGPAKQAAAPGCDYVTTPEDSALAVQIIESLRQELSQGQVPTPELMMHAGQQLLGNEYVAGTLDGSLEEKLNLYLLKTDCILFVETCTNLARAAVDPKFPDNLFYSFADNVRQTRYRDGKVVNYSDRIHYTTEWIRQAQASGIVEDKSQDFGGVVYDHPIHFMSSNNGYYKQLKAADTDSLAAYNLEVIKQVEERLNEEPQYYIPDFDIVKAEPFIQSGDIIGYMSATEGLDIAHVVLACVQDKDGNIVYGPHGDDVKVGFMHASMAAMRVIIDPLSISDYACGRKSITGIKVVRVK